MRQAEVDATRRFMESAFEVYRARLANGWPRELARSVLPVATYSHMFATVNLLNLLKFLTLRCDAHAQYESGYTPTPCESWSGRSCRCVCRRGQKAGRRENEPMETIMAIKNVTEEVAELRAAKELDDRIDALTQEKAAFVLRALIAAKHVSPNIIRLALDLADTIRV